MPYPGEAAAPDHARRDRQRQPSRRNVRLPAAVPGGDGGVQRRADPGRDGADHRGGAGQRGQTPDRARDRDRRGRGDRGRQHRLPDRPQRRSLDAGTTRALPRLSAGRRCRTERCSSRATAPRRCSSAASCSGCACGPRGWPARRTCTGASFVFWNALGGICWATAIGLLAYFLGHAAGNAIETFGIYGLVAVLIAAGGAAGPPSPQRRMSRNSRMGAEQRESTPSIKAHVPPSEP